MLELRPGCERCSKALPPDSVEARICAFECTFCSDCAEGALAGRCPNCGGELLARPRRAAPDRADAAAAAPPDLRRGSGAGERFTIRPVRPGDYTAWRVLWDGYNAFYGREGATALPESITATTWGRFFDPCEPVHALVGDARGGLVGLVHYLFHRSTTRAADVCYLQDLFTAPSARGLGVGRRLIGAVYEAARAGGSTRVYWQTQESNQTARSLYDKLARHAGFIVYSQDL